MPRQHRETSHVDEDWLRRYRASKAVVDKEHAELEAARKRIADLEAVVSRQNENGYTKKKLLSLRRGISEVRKLAGFIGNFRKEIGRFFVKVNRSIPVIEITYSVPSWMTKKPKRIDTPNPQQLTAGPPQEACASTIAFETVHQPLVNQSVEENFRVITETNKPSKQCQDAKHPGVKNPIVNPSPTPIGEDNQQMNM